MSRSYKKTPWCGDKKSKSNKKFSNKRVKNYLKKHPEAKLKGSMYKKVYESWNICDYGWWCDFETYSLKNKSDKTKFFQWYKQYKMK